MLNNEKGFTLVEIMVATVIAMMIASAVYAAFRSSLKVYQHDETRLIMLQRCRTALDRMAQDLNNLFFVDNDEELTFMTQDFADPETTMDKDMLSFVTIVDPKLEDYVANESSTVQTTEEEENRLPSDLARIIYFVGPSPEDENVQSLMRMETTTLDVEELESMMSQLQSSSRTEELLEELRASVLADCIAMLKIRYFDETDPVLPPSWVNEWNMEEKKTLPKAVEITLTITDADNKGKTLTEAIVVYLPFSGGSTEEGGTTAAGGSP